MAESKTPKADQLRALREQREEQRQAQLKAQIAIKPRKMPYQKKGAARKK